MRTNLFRLVSISVVTVLWGGIAAFAVLVGTVIHENPPPQRKPNASLHEEAHELMRAADPEIAVLVEMAGRKTYTREDLDRFGKARTSLRKALEKSEEDYDPFGLEKLFARFPGGIGRVPQRTSNSH